MRIYRLEQLSRYVAADGDLSFDVPALPQGVTFQAKIRVIPTLSGTLHASAATITGLLPAVEALLATSTVREAIREGGARVQDLRTYMDTAGADLGMHSFDQDLYRLHDERRISLDTALANATHRADLERKILIEAGGRGA